MPQRNYEQQVNYGQQRGYDQPRQVNFQGPPNQGQYVNNNNHSPVNPQYNQQSPQPQGYYQNSGNTYATGVPGNTGNTGNVPMPSSFSNYPYSNRQ